MTTFLQNLQKGSANLRIAATVHAARVRTAYPRESTKILFVIGTGRSGTHFLTECLTGHADISDFTGGRENSLALRMVTAAALNGDNSSDLLRKTALVYDALASAVRPAWFVDQSHPNIWFTEYWSNEYPLAYFVGIIRNPYSVVASMMKHTAVRSWTYQWNKFPIPNPFLGITSANVETYETMSLAERCALRWISHYDRLNKIKRILDGKFSVVCYEELCQNPETALEPIAANLGVPDRFNVPLVDRDALTRGASMSATDIDSVRRLLIQEKVDKRWLEPTWSAGVETT
jgi:hypothetical protein